ncbi:MAG: Type 1 glutamine amidotransferase-like domain-containing protein [Bacteriovoracaceae bacterium]
MKLVLYSGGHFDENEQLNQCLVDLTGKKSPQMTFIPSSSYQCEVEYREITTEFRRYGLKKVLLFPVDVSFDPIFLQEAFSSDIIFLGGGNTFYFLDSLRKKGLLSLLKTFVQTGGVLAGLSAGAIICTPTIYTASIPEFDRDENDIKLKNWKSLGLSRFEFFPHYRRSKRYDDALKEATLCGKRSIHALSDGGGIVMEDKDFYRVGPGSFFHNGEKIIF